MTGMLYLAGLGLSGRDIPIGSLDAIARAEPYIERYTSFVPATALGLVRERTGKVPVELSRKDLEDDVGMFVSKAKNADIVLLTGGDPMTATTHKIIINEALDRGIDTAVIHAASIFTAAIGESGLDFYRFGQITTVPRWSGHYKPVSFYEKLAANATAGLHSLVLLDYFPENESSLPIKDTVATLFAAEAHYGAGLLRGDTSVIVMHNIGLAGCTVKRLALGDASGLELGSGPTSIIIPAKLSDIEEETLARRLGL